MTRETPTVDSVAAAIRGYRFRYVDEDELQQGLAAALEQRFPGAVRREVMLAGHLGRIDLVVGTVGVETKVAGPLARVVEQVARYCEAATIDAVLLVTSKASHLRIPAEINGRPVRVVSLLGGAL